MDRGDGWPALKQLYGLPQSDARGLDHDLAYRGLKSGDIDVIDIYTRDTEIPYYGLSLLIDNQKHFPRYGTVILYWFALKTTASSASTAFNGLGGKISGQQTAALNAAVKIKRQSETSVAAGFLLSTFKVSTTTEENGIGKRLYSRTLEYLFLVGISLVKATLVAITLRILSVADILQTIPKLALLVFMIPLLGIGSEPAIAALFL